MAKSDPDEIANQASQQTHDLLLPLFDELSAGFSRTSQEADDVRKGMFIAVCGFISQALAHSTSDEITVDDFDKLWEPIFARLYQLVLDEKETLAPEFRSN